MNLKGFLVECSCKAERKMFHDNSCNVEKILAMLHSHGVLSMIKDIIDVQPISYHEEGADKVKHDEVTE